MSAMAGPRSPTSPWPQESANLQQVSSHPNPAAFLSLCESRPSPFNSSVSSQNAASECSGPSYFSLSVENVNNPKNSRDALSYGQQSMTSPKPQILSQRNVFEAYMDPTRSGPGLLERRDPPVYKLTVANNPERTSTLDRSTPSISPGGQGDNTFISAERCAELINSPHDGVMLLDVRPFTHFSKGHIQGSLNLCIPTTLLKRPSFNTHKLANTFTNDVDKTKFALWRTCGFIIVYDSATSDMKDAAPLTNVLRKFSSEGWDGNGLILCGGFKEFSSIFPALIQQPRSSTSELNTSTLPGLGLPAAAPIAGGCALPDSSQPTIPFFSNIRQHMDLLGGVGQIPLQLPSSLTEQKMHILPTWLRKAVDDTDKGRIVSDKFLDLEKQELERMKQALSYEKPTETTSDQGPGKFRVAGIEKGTKNRYNDIYPFDHSRVKLQGVLPGGCDYVNANFISSEYSDKTYIATQAPVPDTFTDFWRVVWEQDVRLVVSLTAEVERGQVKCHPYWVSGDYGPFRVSNFSQKYIYLNSSDMRQVDFGPDSSPSGANDDPNNPCIVVRHFGLSHSAFPFQPLREVMQLHYPYWPDFGTTSQPAHLVRLVEQCDKISNATAPCDNCSAGPEKRGPMLVHCSAGCGRTGTFCTVDSVLDVLRRQGASDKTCMNCSATSRNFPGNPIYDDNVDLIAKTVSDFRMQRPSMVQNLSQFVLCYESVLEWVTAQAVDETDSQ